MRLKFAFLAFSLITIQSTVFSQSKHWTKWLDRDNPTEYVDNELYNHLKPASREADGFTPVQAKRQIKNSRLGLSHTLEKSIVKPTTYWTSWLDRDNPTATGDYETYSTFSAKPCREGDGYQPVEARCRIKQSQLPWYTARKVITECYACTRKGIECMNKSQYGCGKYDVCCPDFEVKFLCYKAS